MKADPETVGSARAMIGFPKTALEGNNTDELAEFLLERCRNMKRKKSEEVLEQNAADEKAMCVRKKYGDTWLFLYTGFIRLVKYLTKKQYKGIALKCQKQYNIIEKKFGFTFDTRIRKNPI